MNTLQERPAGDAAKRTAAARIRDAWPGWVVIWLPRKSEFQARPDFPAPRNTVVTGRTPEELTAGMARIRPNRTPAGKNS
jgi:hypothetical protein